MPTKQSPVNKEEKKDHKQMLLDLIANQSGPQTAIIMDKAFKTQDKQIEEVMLQGGMTAEDIGKSRGVDFNLLNSLLQNQSSIKATGVSKQQPQEQNQMQQPKSPGILETLSMLIPGVAPARAMASALQSGGNKSKGVYGFDPVTGKVSLQANVPANADVRNMANTGNSAELLSTLPQEQQLAAANLARKFGVRNYDKVIPTIVNGLQTGKTIDQLDDEIRYSGQSTEFAGPLRSAAQQIMAGKSTTDKQSVFDDLDDLKGDPQGTQDYLKRMAIKNASSDQQNQVMGKERTVDFLNEIEGDLDTLEKNGINTGFLSGNYENMLARVGQVQNPEMRKVATKLAVAVMQYRRSMTGVQFGQLESNEYKAMFPNINKVGKFNKASLSALKETFGGDLSKFYQQSMGRENYNKLFGESKPKTQSTGGFDFSNKSTEELRKRLAEIKGGAK